MKFGVNGGTSNPRPPEPQSGALPTELHSPRVLLVYASS